MLAFSDSEPLNLPFTYSVIYLQLLLEKSLSPLHSFFDEKVLFNMIFHIKLKQLSGLLS